jgi:hypothetical protein
MAGLLLGGAGMFAAMYSTQAILPEMSLGAALAPSFGLLLACRLLQGLMPGLLAVSVPSAGSGSVSPRRPGAARGAPRSGGLGRGHAPEPRALLRACVAGSALFFTFVGLSLFVSFRLVEEPFDFSTSESACSSRSGRSARSDRSPGPWPTASAGTGCSRERC